MYEVITIGFIIVLSVLLSVFDRLGCSSDISSFNVTMEWPSKIPASRYFTGELNNSGNASRVGVTLHARGLWPDSSKVPVQNKPKKLNI